jgi:hypothetical protein
MNIQNKLLWFLFSALLFLSSFVASPLTSAQGCVNGNPVGLQLVSNGATVLIECAYSRTQINGAPLSGGEHLLILTGQVINNSASTIDFYKGDFFVTLGGQKSEVEVSLADAVKGEYGLEVPRDNSLFTGKFTVVAGQSRGVLLAYRVGQLPRNGTFSFLHSNGQPTDALIVIEMAANGQLAMRPVNPFPPTSTAPVVFTSEPTVTSGILPTSTPTFTPTFIPTPTLQPTLVIAPPLGGTAPDVNTLGPGDVALSTGNVVLRLRRAYSPRTITTGDRIGNQARTADIGKQHIAFQIDAFNYNAQPVAVYITDFKLILPGGTEIPADHGRSFDHRDEQAQLGRTYQVPDLYLPANPLYNVTTIPANGQQPLLLVFQIPVNTYNVRFFFGHTGLQYKGEIGLLLQLEDNPQSNDYPLFALISEGSLGQLGAYRFIGQTIGQAEPIPGGAIQTGISEYGNCIDQEVPYTLEVKSYQYTEESFFENLTVAPKYEVSGALAVDFGFLLMPFVDAIAGAFNIEASLFEYQRQTSLREVIEDTVTQTINITIPPQTTLVISDTRQSARILVTYTVWVAGQTYDLSHYVNGMLTERKWTQKPCNT